MTDEQFGRLLEGLEAPRRPDEAFAAALLTEIGRELGCESSSRSGAQHPSVRAVRRRRRTGRWPVDLLLVAALVVSASVGLATLLPGAIRDRLAPTPQRATLDAQVRAAGVLRVAIRPDYPQFQIGAEPLAGFDVDVASELGRRLALPIDLVYDTASTMLSAPGGAKWDIALPSVPTWSIDSGAFLATEPYYYWPHWLLVPTSSKAAGIADVAAGPICAVQGDAGGDWLRGVYGAAAASRITTLILTEPSDDACLAALAAGQAVAAVTAHLSEADLRERSNVRQIGSLEAEPRSVVLQRPAASGADPTGLLKAIDTALAAMHSDGTLKRMSESRFGGTDLTGP
jgi:ABC-type amino acid transport substrate-binding protein